MGQKATTDVEWPRLGLGGPPEADTSRSDAHKVEDIDWDDLGPVDAEGKVDIDEWGELGAGFSPEEERAAKTMQRYARGNQARQRVTMIKAGLPDPGDKAAVQKALTNQVQALAPSRQFNMR